MPWTLCGRWDEDFRVETGTGTIAVTFKVADAKARLGFRLVVRGIGGKDEKNVGGGARVP